MPASFLLAWLYLALTLAILAVNKLADTSTSIHPSLQPVHEVLANILFRGQLLIETFPPLSFSLAAVDPAMRAILSRGISSLGHLVVPLVICRNLRLPRWSLTPVLAWGAALWGWGALTHQSEEQLPMETSLILGQSLLLVTLGLLYSSRRGLFGPGTMVLVTLGVPEALLTTAVFLGASPLDGLVMAVLSLADTASTCWRHFGDPSVKAWKPVLNFTLLVIKSATIYVVATVAIVTSVYPLSETSYGGNYNLHYLSPQFRRSLRPEVTEITQLFKNTAAGLQQRYGDIPSYALLPGIPMTVYVPGAGFLWTDNLVWDPVQHTFRDGDDVWNDADADEETLESSLHRRVLFMDEVKWTNIWVLENVVDAASGGYLQPRQPVYFQDSRGHYLTVANRSTQLEEYLDIDSEKEQFTRNLVHTALEPSFEGTWMLLYDPNSDSGFQLYHPGFRCFLATTYRQIPHWDDRVANHSVSAHIHIEIELACSSAPTRAASLLWPVDGYHYTHAIPSPPRASLTSSMWSALTATTEILRGIYELYQFRLRHSDIQDFPPGFRGHSRQTSGYLPVRGVLFAVLLAILAVHSYHRRFVAGREQPRAAQLYFGDWVGAGLCLVYLALGLISDSVENSLCALSLGLLVGSNVIHSS